MYTALGDEVWKPKTSVRLRFALAQGLFISVIIGFLAVVLYFTAKDRLTTTIDNSYRILVNNLAASVFTTFQDGDQQGVVKALQKVEGQSGVKYVMLFDKDNKVYYDSITGSNSEKGKVYTDAMTPVIESTKDTVVQKVDRDGTTYYNYAYPFIVNNEPYYTIRLGVDTAVIEGELNRLSRLFIYLGGFGIFIGVLAAYFLTSQLTRPIVALTESALAIRAGNLNAYPNITTNDELEQLSREFQGMVEKLKQFYFQEYMQKKQALDSKKRLEEINGRLKELDRQKTDFLNTASHQLRTPLSIIHWSLSMIVDEAEHLNLKPDQLELLQESLKSTKRMVDMVNDLLDISRIEQGRKEINWQLANYGRVCGDLVKALLPLAQNKSLELTYQEEGTIPDSYLDPKTFYEVVNNFVDNAIKYTPQGYVHVSCGATPEEIQIKIADSGIGMDEEEKTKLFTRFARGKEASHLFANGSGLGMYVAQMILKQHGGSVTVESEKGKGTTFTLHVPIYHEAPAPVATEATDDLPLDDAQYAQVGATTSAASKSVTPTEEKSASVAISPPQSLNPPPADTPAKKGKRDMIEQAESPPVDKSTVPPDTTHA